MSIPNNPETLVIQNSFYPDGLREIDIYDYYQKAKVKILRDVIGKNLTFYFATSLNNIVVMRRAKTPTGYLRLNYSNYDEVITGRTISIHSNFGRTSDFGIVDIDIDDFDLAKRTTYKVYNYLIKNCKFVEDIQIKYSGKESFHLICNLKRTMYVDNFRLVMRKFLVESNLNNEYTIERKRIKGIPNLDLSSNKYLGGYITLNSLSVIGLKSMLVSEHEVMKFKKEFAKI
jgi:hypothetical protein